MTARRKPSLCLAPPMIPSRPVRQVEQRKDTVQDRLARLRAEQSARDRPRYNSGVHLHQQQNPTGPRWLEAVTNAANAVATPVRLPDRRRGTAGPPAPKSWATTTAAGESRSPSSSTARSARSHPHHLVGRERIAAPLPTAALAEPVPPVKGLFVAAGTVVAEDLARGGNDSLLADYIQYLPMHLRLRLLEVFADWRNELVLEDDVLQMLLRSDESHLDFACKGNERAAGPLGTGSADALPTVEALQLDDDDGGDWDASPQYGDVTSEVESLNLSFSSVSLRTLRAVLLREVQESGNGPPPPAASLAKQASAGAPLPPPPPPPPPPPKHVAVFPFLHTLNLTATSRIPYSDGFFDLLSHLISLRTLSLAGRPLSTIPGSNVHPIGFLARLAAATPTLHTLDVSFSSDLNVVAAVQAVDWDERWLDLRVLGLRREYPEEVSAVRLRQRLKRDVWETITLDRRKKRRWIDIVT
ncbi:hypothetical protein RHOSPDRAFT_37122 [Rhodotorula sp. JG-1b]|nr:hypothetical protein RHOSPDRAFT_37122 [Rhodotorula sp. JG-1b]